jgi:AraC-like DNA-binding protein
MKQVLPFQIAKPIDKNLIIQIDEVPVFYNKLHQHEEIQISLIVRGEGSLLAGDGINHFEQGDVFVLGSNLPHVFKSEQAPEELPLKMISVFFKLDSFGSDFFNLTELKSLQAFFNASEAGFKVKSPSSEISNAFDTLTKSNLLDGFIVFLQLLQNLYKTEKQSLSSFVYDKKFSDNEGKRIRDVFEYTMNNFTKEITLEDIAREAAMTKNAFCRYFKKHTNKTYVTFLNELRIAHACKLLLQKGELPIAEISEQAGFVNISNFNRIFRAIKGCTPRTYRKQKEMV